MVQKSNRDGLVSAFRDITLIAKKCKTCRVPFLNDLQKWNFEKLFFTYKRNSTKFNSVVSNL